METPPIAITVEFKLYACITISNAAVSIKYLKIYFGFDIITIESNPYKTQIKENNILLLLQTKYLLRSFFNVLGILFTTKAVALDSPDIFIENVNGQIVLELYFPHNSSNSSFDIFIR